MYFVDSSSTTPRTTLGPIPTPVIVGSPVPMVPLAGVGGRALERYSGFSVFKRARDREIPESQEQPRGGAGADSSRDPRNTNIADIVCVFCAKMMIVGAF